MAALERFGPATRAWFVNAFGAPTAVQEQGWAQIVAGRHALLLAPTGSGKTLAFLLPVVEQLRAHENGWKIRVLRASAPAFGIDTREDYDAFLALDR